MARGGANMMGWAMLLVVVMASYVGKAQGSWYSGICSVQCTKEKNPHNFGEAAAAFAQCYAECLHYSLVTAKPSPKALKALALLAEAPDQMQQDFASLGRKALPPSP